MKWILKIITLKIVASVIMGEKFKKVLTRRFEGKFFF